MEEIQGYRFGIDLDDGGMQRSLKEIRNEAKLLKSAMRANFTEIRSSGDAMKAYAGKVNDAKRAIEGQKAVITKLKDQQRGLDLTTEKGRATYAKYQQQINRAKTDISSLSAQQERAKKSADLYSSGIVQLQKSTRLASDANEALAKRLDTQGKTAQATAVRNNGLKDSYKSLNSEMQIEKQRLADVAKESGRDSDAYKQQSIRVNNLGTKVAETRKQLEKMNDTGLGHLISSIHKTNEGAEKANHIFGRVFGGQLLASGAINAWTSLTTHIQQAVAAGKEYDVEQQKMHATWLTLRGSNKKASSMVNTVNKYSVATGQDTNLVDELEQGYYHLHSNKNESDKMTRASLNLADAVGINKQQSLAARQDMVNGLSRGTANAGLLNQISQYFPMFREQLAKSMHTQVKNLTGMAKAGEISAGRVEKVFEYLGNDKYKSAADNMMKTMYGMERTIKARVPALLGAMEKPVMDAKNPLYKAVSKWVSDPRTEKEFTKVGKAMNSGIITITKAFGKAFDVKSAPQAMNHAMNSLAKGVTNVSKSIARNAPEITSFFKALKGLGGVGFKTLIDSLKIINFLLKPLIKLIGGHANTVAKFAATWIIASKGLKLFETGLKALDNLKDVIGRVTAIFGIKKETTALAEQNAVLKRNVELQDASATGGSGKANTVKEAEQSVGGGAGKESKVLTEGEDAAKDSKGLRRFIPKLHGLGEIKNVTTAGKALAGSVGVLDVATSATDLIGMKKKTAGSHVGAAAGSLGGTALGATIGTMIMPGIGTAIGAGLGGMAGESVGRKFGKAIQKGLTMQKIHAPKISDKNAYSELDKQAKKHYSQQASQDQKNLKLLYKNGDITKSEYERRLKIVQQNESKMNRLAKMGASDRNAITKYYAQSKQKLTESWNKKILRDETLYGKNSTQVAKDEAKKKKALQQQQLKFATQVTAKEAKLHTTLTGKIKLAANKQESILKKLTSEKGKLSKKQLLQAVNDSNKERKSVDKNAETIYKKAVSAANKKYKATVKAANAEYKGNSAAATKQRKKIISEADTQRKKAVAHAKKQKDDTVDNAQTQYSKTTHWAERQNKGVTNQSIKQYENLKDNNKKTTSNFSTTWHSIWSTVGNWVGKLIHGLNKGPIKGQNEVFKQYGGSKTLSAITASYYAHGTGAFSNMRRPITKTTLGILNDGSDSPETGNREMILHPNGMGELVKGKNVPHILHPRDEVLNASEVRELAPLLGIDHFAKGTGLMGMFGNIAGSVGSFFKGIFGSLKDKLHAISKFIKNPTKTFSATYGSAANVDGTVANNFAGLINNQDKKQGNTWWSTAWNLIHGDASGGPVSGLLKAVEKYGRGHKYVWGGSGPDVFDCSGLVMYALKHAYGIDVPHNSGAQYEDTKVVQHVSKGDKQKGDLVFWGPGEHVGVYAGSDKYYSAYSPSQHPNIGMYNMYSHGGTGAMLFGRVKGVSNKATKKGYKGIQALVHGQLKKSGVWNWVSKHLAPLVEAAQGSPAGDSPAPKGSHKNWLKQAGIPSSWWGAMNSIINAESHWETHATNGKYYGIPQTTSSVLSKAGKDWRTNPITQLRAMKSYIKGRYGNADKALSFRQAHGWYENGGLSTQAKIAHISEHNLPEMVIPLSALKSSRGYELLGKTAAIMAKRDNLGDSNTGFSDKKQIKKLLDKFDDVIGLLADVVNNQQNPIPAVVSSQSVVNTVNQHTKRQKINRNLGRGIPFGK